MVGGALVSELVGTNMMVDVIASYDSVPGTMAAAGPGPAATAKLVAVTLAGSSVSLNVTTTLVLAATPVEAKFGLRKMIVGPATSGAVASVKRTMRSFGRRCGRRESLETIPESPPTSVRVYCTTVGL